ncbi:MAG TPA: class II fructose-1,6-bisphosphate aldolase [Candidatus Krumholzibacteriaceae bacterium]
MLVTNKELLRAARQGKYAVGAFNINNMEFLQAITGAAEELASPAIIALSEGAIKYAGFRNIVEMVTLAAKERAAPISLHLDHGKDMDLIARCIEEGFTSVMIDGSALPFEENVAVTAAIVQKARSKGVSVEGELGKLAGIEDNVSVAEREAILTDPAQAAEFVKRTGVDALAIAVGTSHGAYKFKGEARLAIDRISEIAARVPTLLVLHGASGVKQENVDIANKYGAAIKGAKGVPDDAIVEAIRRGISKVNIDTDMRIAFTAYVRKALAEKPEEIDPRKVLGPGRDAIAAVVREKMKLFGSAGKAK